MVCRDGHQIQELQRGGRARPREIYMHAKKKKIGFTVLVCILGNKVWFADMGNRVWNSKGGLKPRDGYRENYMHASLISHGTSRVQQQLGNRETSIGIEQTKFFFFFTKR